MFASDVGEAPPASAPAAGQRAGRPLDPLRFLWMLRRRWPRIALAALVGVPVGILAALTLVKREYTAQSVLIWEPPPSRVMTAPERELRTLVDTVKLAENLAEVRKRTGQSATLEGLARRIDVSVGQDSNLVTIRGLADDPDGAVQLTDTMTQVFIDHRLNLERARAEDRLRALTAEAERAMEHLRSTREEYDRFREAHGIVDLALERQAAIEEVATLRAELHRSQVAMQSGEARAAILRSAASREPAQTVLLEQQTNPDARRLAELRSEHSARGASLSPEHPEVRGLGASVQALEAKPPGNYTVADRQVGDNPRWTFLLNSLADANAAQVAAERSWRAYAELGTSAHSRVRKLTAVEGQASLLLTGIHLAESRLSELQAERKGVEGAVRQPTAEFRVLSGAERPSRPSRSHRRLVALAFPAVFALLAALVFTAEAVKGLKLVTPAEIAFWGRGPVVATSTWPQEAGALEDLALDLGTSLAVARGVTLLVPHPLARAELATELATRVEQGGTASAETGPREGVLVPWTGPERAQALRRSARQSSRVLVLVAAGAHSAFELAAVRDLLGREERVGFIVVGLPPGAARLPDQVGDVAAFWRAPGEALRPSPPTPA
ncbi:MAG TPA: hypothetical protein VK420_20375 [Longimicrobium sp.]|nr:hypothetical protein [Longimicrobium sp.]